MPTVLRQGSLRIVIYTNDHRPAHVHIIDSGREATFDLHCPDGPPELRLTFGFDRQSLNRIRKMLADRLATLCHQWRQIHGDY
ncbi:MULTISPECIES: DUF4160 domain-containing protein [Tepidiphilus]|uniref:DUF4160 domain-containing protein n=1 Tax=Tepidiphilus baoligensis TaxID=2698687 RepID=A0ABX1QIW2_9PROT|nr:DUF4160 domain-containing protein [Tepidiphilus baoligensis]